MSHTCLHSTRYKLYKTSFKYFRRQFLKKVFSFYTTTLKLLILLFLIGISSLMYAPSLLWIPINQQYQTSNCSLLMLAFISLLVHRMSSLNQQAALVAPLWVSHLEITVWAEASKDNLSVLAQTCSILFKDHGVKTR